MLENARKLFEQANRDKTLQESLKGTHNTDAFARKAVEVGEKRGLLFTINEVKEVLKSAFGSDELSEAQLDAVAGGGDEDSGGPYCQ